MSIALIELSAKLQSILDANDGGFVVVSIGEGGNQFVQACVAPRRSEDGSFDLHPALWLDVPLTPLTRDEADRAARFFASKGVECPAEECCADRRDKPMFVATYKLVCGRDSEAAAKSIVDALRAIYEPVGCMVLMVEEGRF